MISAMVKIILFLIRQIFVTAFIFGAFVDVVTSCPQVVFIIEVTKNNLSE